MAGRPIEDRLTAPGAAGVALRLAAGSLCFRRMVACVAVFHFIRWQVGWVATYRSRAGRRGRADVGPARIPRVDGQALYGVR